MAAVDIADQGGRRLVDPLRALYEDRAAPKKLESETSVRWVVNRLECRARPLYGRQDGDVVSVTQCVSEHTHTKHYTGKNGDVVSVNINTQYTGHNLLQQDICNQLMLPLAKQEGTSPGPAN